jgi:hypothetical protein
MLWIGSGNPYPDPTFHFDVDPDFDLDPEPAPSFTHIRGNQNFFGLYSQPCQSTLLHLSCHGHRCHNFEHFVHYIDIFW